MDDYQKDYLCDDKHYLIDVKDAAVAGNVQPWSPIRLPLDDDEERKAIISCWSNRRELERVIIGMKDVEKIKPKSNADHYWTAEIYIVIRDKDRKDEYPCQ